MQQKFDLLNNYVPKDSIRILYKWFQQRPFDLKITKKRSTKFGDFRVLEKQELPQISVNSNLNEFAFLITLTHEFAHLLVWHKHQHKVKAHGLEWKKEFTTLMSVLIAKKIFPNHLETVLNNHIKNPPASSAKDVNLVVELKKYDAPANTVYLSNLPEGTKFTINNKKTFSKGKKRRTRYLCQEISTKKEYLIHGIAEVLLINN
jgi:hypothetical protein